MGGGVRGGITVRSLALANNIDIEKKNVDMSRGECRYVEKERTWLKKSIEVYNNNNIYRYIRKKERPIDIYIYIGEG